MWGAGLILIEMLTGQHPFDIENAEEAVKQIRQGETIVEQLLEKDRKEVQCLTREAKDLIRKLMKNDPDERLSASQALKSEWI